MHVKVTWVLFSSQKLAKKLSHHNSRIADYGVLTGTHFIECILKDHIASFQLLYFFMIQLCTHFKMFSVFQKSESVETEALLLP